MDQNPSKPLPPSAETNRGMVAGDLPPNPPENPLTPHIRSKRVLNAATQGNLATLKETLGLLSLPTEVVEIKSAGADVNLTDVLSRASQLTFEFGEGDDFMSRTHQNFITSAPIVQELRGGIQIYRQKISGYESQLASLGQNRESLLEEKTEFDSKGLITRARNAKSGREIEEKLSQIDSQIRTLQLEQGKLQTEVERAESTLLTVESLEAETATRMVTKVTDELKQKYDTFQAELVTDPDLKRKLNEMFLEKEFMPQLKQVQKEKKIPQEVVDEYLKLVWGQLEDGTAIYDSYPSEKKDRIEAQNKRMREMVDLPNYGYPLSKLLYSVGLTL